MTLKSVNEHNIKDSFANIFNSVDDYKHLEQMLSFRLLSEVEKITDERNILRKDLASMIGVSASYITQLYRGNKVVNLEILAKLEEALGFRFSVSAVAPDLLEIGEECSITWDEEQINFVLNKFKSPKGSFIFRKNVWGETQYDNSKSKTYKVKSTHESQQPKHKLAV